MKRNMMRGSGKVFGFTLKQICTGKGWLISTFLIAFLLLAGIPLVLLGISSISEEKDHPDPDEANIQEVIVCDETEGEVDYNYLKEFDYEELQYRTAENMDAAIEAITDKDSTVILHIENGVKTYALTVYLPDESEISRSKGHSFASFVAKNFSYAQMLKSNISPEALALLSMPVTSDTVKLSETGEEVDHQNIVEQIIEMAFPLIMIMLMYMMVLAYGQSIGQTILVEKTSKLMDTMLISIHPFALILGKLFASALAAVIQILLWGGCLVGGVMCGIFCTHQIMPDVSNETINGVETLIDTSSLFSVSGIAITILIAALGFLLYLSLASVSGSLASKAEDLGKTNYIFVLVLIASFFLCLASPENSDSMIKTSEWLNYFPFTAILVVPGQVLLGKIAVSKALLIACIMLASSVLLVYVAATVYRLMVLYRGDPPSPKKLFAMIMNNDKHTKGDPSND